jgi:hypothetical protein
MGVRKGCRGAQLLTVVSLHLDEHPSKFVKGLGLIAVVGPDAVRLDGLLSCRDVFPGRGAPLLDVCSQVLIFEWEDELEDTTMRALQDALLVYGIAQNLSYSDRLGRLHLVFVIRVMRWHTAEHELKFKKLATIRRDIHLGDAVGHQDTESLSEGICGWT